MKRKGKIIGGYTGQDTRKAKHCPVLPVSTRTIPSLDVSVFNCISLYSLEAQN